MIGRTLAHYKVVELLGVGGMGEVYVAEDTKLDRRVALKLLPKEMAEDPDRLQRFEREAKTVAGLDHPNIVTLHSIEEAEGTSFITMQLVEGRTLADVIPPGGLPIDKFFAIAVPLADALGVAHEKGITHRDLKPSNVMVADDGAVKVLDFGLAKLIEEEPSEDSATSMGTQHLTGEGQVLGTAAYMSPEQAEGKPIDHRSDIFSLGILFYQMITGNQPFTGDTNISLITSIIRDDPVSITEVRGAMPRHLGRIINHCLEKDPERRYQSSKDLRNDLEGLQREIASGELIVDVDHGAAAAATASKVPWIVAAAAVVVALLALAFGGLGGLGDRREDARSGAFPATISTRQLTTQPGGELAPSLTPDGDWVVYSGEDGGDQDIFLQSVGGQNRLNLTEQSDEDDGHPALSPDGQLIAFRSERQGGGLFVMGRTGESPQRLTDFGYNPSWSPDGTKVVFSSEGIDNSPDNRFTNASLSIVDVASREVTEIYDGDAVEPRWSPNGHRIAFWTVPAGSGQRDVLTIPAAGGEAVAVTAQESTDWQPVWSPDGGHLYFSSRRGGAENIWRVAIDEVTGETLGEPQPVTTAGSGRRFGISLSADGSRLAYVDARESAQIMRLGLDADGSSVSTGPEQLTRGSRQYGFVEPSPDGEWIAVTAGGAQEDIVIMRVDGSERTQLTDSIENDRQPRWSPDGSRISFYSNATSTYEIWLINPDGSDLTRLTDTQGANAIYSTWSPDGERIGYVDLAVPGQPDASYVIEVNDPSTVVPLPPLPDGSSFLVSDWSPDGRLIAGTRGTVDNPLPNGVVLYSLETESYEVLTEEGHFPMWRDADRLFYTVDGSLWTLHIPTGDVREVFTPETGEVGGFVSIDKGGGWVYFILGSLEADVWMMEIEEGGS